MQRREPGSELPPEGQRVTSELLERADSEEEGHPWDQAEVSPEGWVWKWKEAETKRRSGMGRRVAGRQQGAWDRVVIL